tara:strand:- start:2319 stop:2879 length:561 start_codon:yes stop_codon:yes gene_type:complete
MPREMLKLRKGDSAIMIKADGSIQMAGLNDRPLIDEKGAISPCILFAAAWAKKDQKLLMDLVENFKTCVKEGYFGPEAQSDYKAMEAAAASATTTQAASGTVTKEAWNKHKAEEERLKALAAQGQDPQVKRQMDALKAGARKTTTKPFEGHLIKDTASGAVTVGTAIIEEQPKPLTSEEAVTRRDS